MDFSAGIQRRLEASDVRIWLKNAGDRRNEIPVPGVLLCSFILSCRKQQNDRAHHIQTKHEMENKMDDERRFSVFLPL